MSIIVTNTIVKIVNHSFQLMNRNPVLVCRRPNQTFGPTKFWFSPLVINFSHLPSIFVYPNTDVSGTGLSIYSSSTTQLLVLLLPFSECWSPPCSVCCFSSGWTLWFWWKDLSLAIPVCWSVFKEAWVRAFNAHVDSKCHPHSYFRS